MRLPNKLDHRLVTRCTARQHAVGQCIGIDTVGSQVFEHTSHDTLSGGDVSGQTDDELTCPFAHVFTIVKYV